MRAIKGFAYFLELILVLVLIFLCFLWWSFSTPEGTKRLLSTTQQRMQNVSYQYESGNLLEGIVLKEASWQLKNGTSVSGENLRITSNPSCWQSKELCLDNGTIDKLTINLPLTKVETNEITLNNLSLLLSIKARVISIKELIIAHPSRPDIVFKNAEFSGSINESKITLQQFNTQWNELTLNASGSLTMQDDYPINMQGSASRALGGGTLQTSWSAGGNLKKLQLDATIKKPFNAQLNGVVSLLDRRLPANMTFQWNRIELPFNDDTPNLLVSDGKIDIGGTWPDYTTHGNAKLSGPNLPSGAAVLTGRISTTALNFEPLTVNTLNGSIDSTGQLTWDNDIQWQAAIDAHNLQPQHKWPEISGDLQATASLTGVLNNIGSEVRLNNINGHGTINGIPLTAEGNITQNSQQQWRIDNLQLNSDNNHINAHGTIGESVKLVFSLLSADLILPGVKGDLHGDLTLLNDLNNPTVQGSITTASLHYKDIELQNAKFNGIAHELGRADSTVRFQAQTATINNRVVNRPDLSFKGSIADHLVKLKLSSDPIDSAEFEIVGSADEYYNWNGSVTSVGGNVANRRLSLSNPFTAIWINENQTLAVEPHCWLYNVASVCVENSALIGKTGVVQFALNRLPLESVKEFIPDDIDLSGTLMSSGNLSWGPNQKTSVIVKSYLENATARINKSINNNQLQMKLPVAQLDVTTTGYKIHANLHLESDKFSTLNADVVLDTARRSLPIKGTANLNEGQLSWIQDFLPDVNLLDGELNAEAVVSGSLFEPMINSEIRLQNGKVQSALLPIELKEIDIGVNIEGRSAIIEGTALANNADVTIGGEGAITPEGISSNLNLTGSGIKIKHEYAENATLSPNLNFKVRPNNIEITGKVEVPSAQITVQSLASDGVSLSKDIIITDDLGKSHSRNTVGSTGINTQVDISLGNDVSIDAYGLNADLNGDFQFTLDAGKPPALAGDISVSNGSYRAYGQDLKIRDGQITFTGPVQQTALSVEAVREIKGLLAGVRISGTASNPTTSLFSEPAIPEEEILPYIILGRKLDFSESDTGMLRKAALMLGVDTGRKVSSKLARNLGIDDFTLSAWGTGDDTQILVSGKLNDKLLLRYGVGVFKKSNSLYLRYDLADRFYLETSQGLESAVDLFYAFDF